MIQLENMNLIYNFKHGTKLTVEFNQMDLAATIRIMIEISGFEKYNT